MSRTRTADARSRNEACRRLPVSALPLASLLLAGLAALAGAPALRGQTRPPPVARAWGEARAGADEGAQGGGAAPEGARPVPYPVWESPEFARAVSNGTRTRTGEPGPGYWQQYARYRIEARLDPAANLLSGHERILYLNRSPDTLSSVDLYLRQNLFAPGVERDGPVPVTGGMRLESLSVGGRPLARTAHVRREPGYAVRGTVAWLHLPAPLAPGDSLELEVAWSYHPAPSPSDGREGHEGNVYFQGYWYPQMAVYDDIDGWVTDPYLGQGEFYMGYADYDVRLTVPAGWLVDATGTLQNPGQVLSERTRRRLAEARRAGRVVHVVDAAELKSGGSTLADGPTATWHYTASDVRDFAWGSSDVWLWDATRALVGDSAAPDTVAISSFYRDIPKASAWAQGGARYTADAIESLSKYLWPYPYPHMTSMEGILTGGGMEYPMMTVMQPWSDTLSLAGDLMHETGHMWFPMQVGSNETRYVWMDEGLTQFDAAQGMRLVFGAPRTGGRPNDSEAGQRMLYLMLARTGEEAAPLMRWGDEFPASQYFLVYYDKTAQVLAALRGILGPETFRRALREYGRRWLGKHPQPYDFFNTFHDVTGRDLSWFWRSWFYETWPLDQAIGGVSDVGDSTRIFVEDRGLVPMPVRLRVTRADGTTERRTVPVDSWLSGSRRTSLEVARRPRVVKVEIDPEGLFPDVDRTNQLWKR